MKTINFNMPFVPFLKPRKGNLGKKMKRLVYNKKLEYI